MLPKRILAVEPHALSRKVLRWLLQEAGYEVISAADGLEAMRLCTAFHPDLILTEFRLPQGNGLDVLAHANKQMPRPPVLWVTCATTQEDELAAWHLGVRDIIDKPFDIDELLERVRRRCPPTCQESPCGGGE